MSLIVHRNSLPPSRLYMICGGDIRLIAFITDPGPITLADRALKAWHQGGKIFNRFASGHETSFPTKGNPRLESAAEEDVGRIEISPFGLERGLLHEGKVVRLLGEPNQCHANASELWLKSDGEASLCTGYALTEKQSWLQHSWCVATDEDHGPLILETTDPEWTKYFGVVLDEEESFVFVMTNIKRKERLKEVFAESPRMAERLGEILASQMGLPLGGDAEGDSHGVA